MNQKKCLIVIVYFGLLEANLYTSSKAGSYFNLSGEQVIKVQKINKNLFRSTHTYQWLLSSRPAQATMVSAISTEVEGKAGTKIYNIIFWTFQWFFSRTMGFIKL